MNLRTFFASYSSGLHYAVRILIGTAVTWFLLRKMGDTHAIWAIISLIVVTDPQLKTALTAFRFRIYNTIIGSVVGLLFLFLIGPKAWTLPLAATVTAFIATRLTPSQPTWRIAPITAAIVMSAGFLAHSKVGGGEAALERTGEVFLGGAIALLVTWLLSLVWMPPDETPHEQHSASG